MCISTPNLDSAATAIPDRQAARLPDSGDAIGRTDDAMRRRRALMSTIFTSAGGTLGAPSVTGGGTAGTAGLGSGGGSRPTMGA